MIFSTSPFESSLTSAAARVALGDAAYQLEVSCILNHCLHSRSLNRASLARHVPTNLAAYSTDTIQMVSAHRYNDSFFFSLFMICGTIRLDQHIIH